jgi:hypothetical protein
MSLSRPAEEPHPAIPDIVDRPILRVSGPGDIVQIVPYMFGFHPRESVALIALRGLRIVVSVRNDLDAPVDLVEPWCREASKAGADHVVALIYTSGITGPPLPHSDTVDELAALFASHGLEEVDVIAVSDGRWWSYRCTNARCCPPEGMPIDDAGAIAASAVSEGLVALDSRDELERELQIDALAMNVVEAEIDKFLMTELQQPEKTERDLRAQDWAVVRRFVKRMRKQPSFTPPEAARVLCALLDRSVRDAAIGYLVSCPDHNVSEAWRRLTRVAPPEWRAAPATLYALWRYANGDGARSNIAIDTALDADPEYTLAHLLLELMGTGMNPFEFIHEMATHAQLVGRRIQRKRHPSGRRGAPLSVGAPAESW